MVQHKFDIGLDYSCGLGLALDQNPHIRALMPSNILTSERHAVDCNCL